MSKEEMEESEVKLEDEGEPTEETSQQQQITGTTESAYEQEISRLRELIASKNEENLSLELKLSECEQSSKLQMEQLNQNFTLKLEQTLKKFQEGHKDKTSSLVMKYAEAEKKCIDLNRNIEFLQSKLNGAAKEKLSLIERFEKAKSETDKLNKDFEKKIEEVMAAKKESEKLREALVLSEAKEKAALLKLKCEVESHAASKKLLEQANLDLDRLKKELEQSDEENEEELKKDDLESDQQLATVTTTETQMDKSNKSEIVMRELNALKSQLKDMFEERTTLRDRLQCMEVERKLQEASIGKYKETLQSQKQMNKDLLNEILQLRELQETLSKEKSEKTQLEYTLKITSTELAELQVELSSSKEKQNELLEFTAKLTEKNTQLQTANSSIDEKLESVQEELDKVTKNLNQASESFKLQLESLSKNVRELNEKNRELSEKLTEKEKEADELTLKLSDEQDENNSLKKKHAANIKDLTRQLQVFQKKMTNVTPNNSNQHTPPLNQTASASFNNNNVSFQKASQNSRKNSLSSLNEKDSLEMTSGAGLGDDDSRSSIDSTTLTGAASINATHASHYGEVICGGSADDVYVVDIDKQKIIEKIVKLQKLLAKRNEKIDFLQDHVNQLTNDLKRKTRIIQAYAINEEVGAFTSEAQDSIKREMSRRTGIMSTLYKTNKSYIQTAQFINTNESNMTMELCLEINGKLQALLEDTLIKNITLKESLETLGQEIARLSQENRHIKLSKQ